MKVLLFLLLGGHLMHSDGNPGIIRYSASYLNSRSVVRCLRFWYHMNHDVGILHVRLDSHFSPPVWVREGDQGPIWHQGLINLPSGVDYNHVSSTVKKHIELCYFTS